VRAVRDDGNLSKAPRENLKHCQQLSRVEKSYAMQAGREIRVIVEPSKIDDHEAMQMARNISKQIEEELSTRGKSK